ncbi:MAG: hypothetical protein HUU17_14085 [Chthonomonadales bacterium]|nr:hypothetical protein [Chthonomonadales bacterium]
MDTRRIHILVVHDETERGDLVCRSLQDAPNIEVTALGTLAQYRDYIARVRPDLALMELRLSDGNVAEALQPPPASGDYPVLIIADEDGERDAMDAVRAGAHDYILCPCRTRDLQHRIEQTLREWSEKRRSEEAHAWLIGRHAELERALSETTDRLDAAVAELDAFTYSVAHDLRAPLRAMVGFGDALAETCGPELDDAGRHYLSRVMDAADRMSQLIEDLLTLSQVTRSEMQRRQVNLSLIAQQIIDHLAASEPERRVAITIQPEMRDHADPGLVTRLLDALLSNAWKFTSRVDRMATILFGQRQDSEGRVYYVQDNGAGINMAYADKLFVPFQRQYTRDQFPGTGIGLAIARRAVQRHGGRIWADGAVGEGATLYFTLGGSDAAT